jgi:hypothetical protein
MDMKNVATATLEFLKRVPLRGEECAAFGACVSLVQGIANGTFVVTAPSEKAAEDPLQSIKNRVAAASPVLWPNGAESPTST